MSQSILQHRHLLIVGGGFLGVAVADRAEAAGMAVHVADVVSERCRGNGTSVDMTSAEAVQEWRTSWEGADPHAIVVCLSTRGGRANAGLDFYTSAVRNLNRVFPQSWLVLCSSTALYGRTRGEWVEEKDVIYPSNDALRDLQHAEQAVMKGCGSIVRLAAIYGEGRCVLLEQFLRDGSMISGDTDRWVNYIHRDDAVEALMCILAEEAVWRGRVANAADGVPMQLKDIYHQLSVWTGISPQPHGTGEARRRGATNQRISSSLLQTSGWKPQYADLMAGLSVLLKHISRKDNNRNEAGV